MKKLQHKLLSLAILGCLSSPLLADQVAEDDGKGHAIGASLNTFGIGVFYTYKLNENFHIRTSLHGASNDDVDEVEISDNDYDGDIDSTAVGLMLDWYPASTGWQRNIFVSGGAVYADAEFEGDSEARGSENIRIGRTNVRAQDINGVNLKIEGQQLVPYLGVGWGNKARRDKGFAFVTELGLMYLKDADVTLTVDDPNNLISQADIARERDDIIEEGNGIQAFGSVGFSYHF